MCIYRNINLNSITIISPCPVPHEIPITIPFARFVPANASFRITRNYTPQDGALPLHRASRKNRNANYETAAISRGGQQLFPSFRLDGHSNRLGILLFFWCRQTRRPLNYGNYFAVEQPWTLFVLFGVLVRATETGSPTKNLNGDVARRATPLNGGQFNAESSVLGVKCEECIRSAIIEIPLSDKRYWSLGTQAVISGGNSLCFVLITKYRMRTRGCVYSAVSTFVVL